MVCYMIPSAAAIIHYVMRKKVSAWGQSFQHLWLNLMLVGGAIFGIVDHLWNGELFLISSAPLMDLMLGMTITVVICVAWWILISLNRMSLSRKFEAVS